MIDADAALRALAHPGRRRAVALVGEGAVSAGELAEACGWTRPATSQHLKVLREAGLVEVRKEGTRRLYRARQEGLAQLRAFLDEFWTGRLGALAEHVDAAPPGESAP